MFLKHYEEMTNPRYKWLIWCTTVILPINHSPDPVIGLQTVALNDSNFLLALHSPQVSYSVREQFEEVFSL